MPKEITDVKVFLQAVVDDKKKKDNKLKAFQKGIKNTKVLFIKQSKKITKFKLRTKRYLYTFKTADKEKATKILQSVPSTLQKVDIKSKKILKKKAKK